jgi:hypothetical protein
MTSSSSTKKRKPDEDDLKQDAPKAVKTDHTDEGFLAGRPSNAFAK